MNLPTSVQFPGKEKIVSLITLLTFFLLLIQLYWTYNLDKVVRTQQNLPVTDRSTLFSSQNATIRGKILKIGDRKMTVENDQKIMGDVGIGRVVLINDADSISLATTSAQINNIKLNQAANINLSLIENSYIVTSITYR